MAGYDAVVVGGSFAGLAVAGGLKGDILLIDKNELGAHTNSACATPLSVLERLDCMDSVVQVYDKGYIHTATKTVEYSLPYPFCSFDYQTFCLNLSRRMDVTVVKASVLGFEEGHVITDQGEFGGTCVIDASGWKAVLASRVESGFVDRSKMSFGIEAVARYRDSGLHFWVEPCSVNRGVGWLFPRGEQAGIGVGSYIGETKLGPNLQRFLEEFQADPESRHGGYFTWRMRKPTVGGLFLVGDAAGQCLPLTGEGIRPGMYFGTRCAEIVQNVIDGTMTPRDALKSYERLVRGFHWYYMFLEGLQKGLLSLPDSWLTRFLAFLNKQSRCDFVLNQYEKRMNLSALAA